MDDPESLKRWMADYMSSNGELDKQSGDDKPKLKPDVIQKTTFLQKPRIVNFSGKNDPKEISFETWRFEVSTCLREGTYSRKEIETAAKKSLRGGASEVVRRMGVDANLDSILSKLSCIYGVVEQPDCLLTQFYGAQQRPVESVADWACRLEDLLDRANQQQPIHGSSIDEMLRNRFWHGLRKELKDAARGKAERITDFDVLLVEVRRIECEDRNDKTNGQLKVISSSVTNQQSDDCNVDPLKALLAKMDSRLDNLEKSVNQFTAHKDNRNQQDTAFDNNSAQHGRGRGRGGYRSRGHGGYNGGHNATSARYNPQELHNNNNDSWRGNTTFPTDNNTSRSHITHNPVITCFRCGQPGHVAYGCRVDLDHLN